MNRLKGVCIGSGYFSRFHYDAWDRIPQVTITGLCSIDETSANLMKSKYKIPKFYADFKEMLLKEKPDFVDVITPPDTHDEICRFAADLGINIICQKPIAPSFEESSHLIKDVSEKVRLIVHENFRFQPWHQEIKKLLDEEVAGGLFNLNFRSRMGDGWGPEAYLSRQPYFRTYPRLLIYETGIHYIDVFKYHGGEIEGVFAILRKLNPVIEGEDCGMMMLKMKNGAVAVWDANRYNDNNYKKDRFTFGEYLIEGTKGTIRLYSDGKITVQPLGKDEKVHQYEFTDRGFLGDCCYRFQLHAQEALLTGKKAETEGTDYLNNLIIQEAVYKSSNSGKVVQLGDEHHNLRASG